MSTTTELPTLRAYNYGLVGGGRTIPASRGIYGIEVTDSAVAALCDRGNLDPQHGPSATEQPPTAVEAAMSVFPPPPGTWLVTIRPDSDALGAMGLLAWRAAGQRVTLVMESRIARIAAMDRHDREAWQGPRPLPESATELGEDWPGADLSALAAMAFDRTLSLKVRVGYMIQWLVNGKTPTEHLAVAHAHAESLIASLRSGATRVQLSESQKFAQVQSQEHGALELGYRLADTVLATNVNFCFPDGTRGNKHTIARWKGTGMETVCSALELIEPGWGGQRGIIGSPQFRPSKLTQDQVAKVIEKELWS